MDIAALKQDVLEGRITIRHVPGIRQVADVLTKKTASPELIRKVLSTGSLKDVLDGVDM